MTWLPSLYVGFGAIQLFTALSFGLLTRRAALAKAQTSFGWVAVMLGVSSLLQYGELLAETAHTSAFWQSLVLASHFATLLAFTPFARAYFALEDDEMSMRLSFFFLGLVMMIVLAGAAYDPSALAMTPSTWAPGPERPFVRMTGIGMLCAILGFVGYGVAWAPGIRKLLRAPLGRELPVIMSLTTLAYSLDFYHHVMGIRALPMAPISAVAFSLALSVFILRDYLDVRSALERQTSELRLRYDQIAFIETEIDKKEPLAIVGDLSGAIARQIQMPVATLREASADLRLEGLSESNREHALRVLDAECNRLNRLITDLLTYAKPMEPQFGRVDVRAVFAEATRSIEETSGARVRVELDVADEVATLEGDASLLTKATLLLLENAAHLGSRETAILVRGRPYREGGRDFLRLEVTDSGGWISSLARASLVSPRRSEGAQVDALEIGIIEKVIHAHQGSFFFERRADGGLAAVAMYPLHQTA